MSTSVAQAATQLGSMAATVILARLLSPTDFGLIAVTQSILGAGSLLSLAGLNASLISRKARVDLAGSTYFWLSLGIGGVFAVLIAVLASPVTSLVGVPDAAPLVVLLAAGFPFSLAVLVPQALLQRQLAFASLNIALVGTAGVYFIGEVVLVMLGWGAWGVIAAQVLSAIFGLLLSLRLARWLPRHGFSPSEIRQDVRVLSGVSATQVTSYLYKNIDYWVVGRALGTSAVGAYYVAYVLPNIVRLRLTAIYSTIMLPALSTAPTLASAGARWRQATTLLLFLSVPSLVGIAAIGEPLVHLFFGTTWTAAIVPMQILVVGTVVDVLWAATSTMAVARQRMGPYTVVYLFRFVATAVIIVGALSFSRSITAVAWAVVLAGALSLLVQDRLLGRPLGVGLATLSEAILRIASACCVMAAVAYVTVERTAALPPVAQVGLGVAVGASTFMAWMLVVSRRFTVGMLAQVRAIVRSGRQRGQGT